MLWNQAEEKGIERGKLLAFLDMVRQHLLTVEVASQQLGMTVAEFEALLWDKYNNGQENI